MSDNPTILAAQRKTSLDIIRLQLARLNEDRRSRIISDGKYETEKARLEALLNGPS